MDFWVSNTDYQINRNVSSDTVSEILHMITYQAFKVTSILKVYFHIKFMLFIKRILVIKFINLLLNIG